VKTHKDLDVSLGSLVELETQIIIAHEIGYLENYDYSSINKIKRMLLGLIKHIKSKNNE